MDRPPSTISPQLALILNDLGSVAFVISWLPPAIFVAAAVLSAGHRGHRAAQRDRCALPPNP
ncbi:MAG: hypothetical protein WAK76_20910 [Trebonia sp.]